MNRCRTERVERRKGTKNNSWLLAQATGGAICLATESRRSGGEDEARFGCDESELSMTQL